MRERDSDNRSKGKSRDGERRRDAKPEKTPHRPAKSGERSQSERSQNEPWGEHPASRGGAPKAARPDAGRSEPWRKDARPRPAGARESRSDARAEGQKPSSGEPKRPFRGPADRPFRKKIWRPAARDRDGASILYGWHSVKAALENPDRKFLRLLLTENAARRLEEDGVALPVTPELVRPDEIDALLGPDAVHQGLMAEAEALASPDIEELEPRGIVLVLDQITDPHNVGAMLRTAAAFGVEAVVTTVRHSPEATGVLAKAASGALDYMPLIAVTNLARALDVLKDKFVMRVGLDSTGDADIATLPLAAPLALVLGAEGKGLRHLTRTKCDAVARLDLPGKIKSLNVSNATALALYVARTRLFPAL